MIATFMMLSSVLVLWHVSRYLKKTFIHDFIITISATIAACLLAGLTEGLALAGCIGAAIGAEDTCYPCICDVIEHLHMGSCSS